jgi:hypothetical protein
LPPHVDIGSPLLPDGELAGQPAATRPSPSLSLGALRGEYLAVHPNGAMGEYSPATVCMRRRHIHTTLGASLATGFVDSAQSPQAHLPAGA